MARGLLTVLATLTWFATAPAQATVLLEVPIDDMIADADSIVMGEVVRVQTRVVLADGAMHPWTVTQVRVDDWLKGSGADVVTIHERGGEWLDRGMRIAGTPEYRVGERVVAFLRRDERGQLRTYGMVQGRFVIRAGVDTATTVERNFTDVAFAGWSGGGMEVGHRDSRPLPLRELLGRISFVLRSSAPTIESHGGSDGATLELPR